MQVILHHFGHNFDPLLSGTFREWKSHLDPPADGDNGGFDAKASSTNLVCAMVWILSILFFTLEIAFYLSDAFLMFQLISSCLISYLVMITSTLILLLKIKQLQLNRKKALKLTLFALICFIVFRLPLSILSIINYIKVGQSNLKTIIGPMKVEDSKEIILLVLLAMICIALNSSINPIIYFLAGRNKEDQFIALWSAVKLTFQRIFRCEEDTQDDEMQPDEI
ncbi:hypothetical protein E2320_011738 [Naja naja]|nr:hypothetical protein E2320_011738 [Naja naja]